MNTKDKVKKFLGESTIESGGSMETRIWFDKISDLGVDVTAYPVDDDKVQGAKVMQLSLSSVSRGSSSKRFIFRRPGKTAVGHGDVARELEPIFSKMENEVLSKLKSLGYELESW